MGGFVLWLVLLVENPKAAMLAAVVIAALVAFLLWSDRHAEQ